MSKKLRITRKDKNLIYQLKTNENLFIYKIKNKIYFDYACRDCAEKKEQEILNALSDEITIHHIAKALGFERTDYEIE